MCSNGKYPHSEITSMILACALEVHRHLGPGLLESPYEDALAYEFDGRRIAYVRQSVIPVVYKGKILEGAFRPDFIVEDKVVVEIKSIAAIADIFIAQTLTYLKITGCEVGLLINFNVPVLSRGIKRLILTRPTDVKNREFTAEKLKRG